MYTYKSINTHVNLTVYTKALSYQKRTKTKNHTNMQDMPICRNENGKIKTSSPSSRHSFVNVMFKATQVTLQIQLIILQKKIKKNFYNAL